MIGTATLSRLIDDGSYDIYLVSRGTWPFDSSEVIQPFVHSIICDRSNDLSNCDDLMKVVQDTDAFYAVLDFSGFEPKWIEDAIQVLGETQARVYIYVSTDSVYEVSEGAEADITSNRNGVPPKKLVESQAKRPLDVTVQRRLNEVDVYGHEKLGGEEVLVKKSKFPYILLRFADIIGPRDGTDRWMLYHIWIKYFQAINVPISVPDEVERITTSITFVEDAASSILLAMETKEAWNEAYNVACEEDFNVVSGIKTIADILGVKGVKITVAPAEQSFAVYPSVRRGPMNISRAREVLHFTPTPMEEVLRKTAEWYENIFKEDEELRMYMLEEFIEDVIGDDNDHGNVIERLLEAVSQELGIEYDFSDKDEYDEDESEL